MTESAPRSTRCSRWRDRVQARRDDGERGVVLVELAMVLPLLIFVALGMIEMGAAWRDQQTVTQSSRQGARVASHLGADRFSDREALEAALSVLTAEQRANINFIVIYEADDDGDMKSSNCMNVSVSGLCNHYTPAMLTQSALDNDANFNTSGTTYDSRWRPSARDVTLLGAPLDQLGVYVSLHRDWFTGYLPGDGMDIGVKTVMQMEPEL